MAYHGDIRLGDTIDLKFSTVNSASTPTTLAGSPAVAAYVGNGTTEITAGITLTVDFDGRTGYHNVRVVATSGNGYASGTDVSLCLTAGTVGGVSVVGMQIGSFSIEHRSALMPTTAARTLDVSAGGEGGLDWANIGSPTTTVNLSGTSTLALEPTTAGRKLDVSAGGEAGLDWANIGSPTTAQNLSGTNIDTDQVVASVTGAVGSIGAGGIASTSFAAGAIDAAAIAANAIGASEIAASAITSAKFAAGAIDANALATDAVNEIRDAIFARAYSAAYGGLTFEQITEVIASACAAVCSGLATTTATYRNLNDSADVIVATVDADGNRSAVTLTP